MSSALTNLWRQFVQRRLWPVAVLLVAALAAVPVLLSEDPAPPAPPPPAPVTTDDAPDELAAQPIVAPSEGRISRRKVLGASKNPFGVAKQQTAPSAQTDGPIVNVEETGGGGADDAPTGGSAPSPGTGSTPSPSTPAPAPTTPAEPTPPPKKYAHHELTVRFGGADDASRQSVKRLQALPSEELPVLIYTGVLKDGKTAVFLVDHGVVADGDGECNPSPEQCETIRLQVGETEFFDVKDETGNVTGQYQLDLLKIHKSRSSSEPATRSKSSVAASSAQPRRSDLRAAVGRVSAQLP